MGEQLQAALDARNWGKRTLAAAIVEKTGRGTINGWRSMIGRTINGTQPTRKTAVDLARGLDEPDDFFLNGARRSENLSLDDLESLRAEVSELGDQLDRIERLVRQLVAVQGEQEQA